MAAEHDQAYKLLFSHPAMVADLLKGYLAREWIGELDLERLESIPESHLSDDLRERHNDCIWRLPWRDPAGGAEVWLYIYLMLEFQSTIDPTMPVRILSYLGLLYQDLLRAKEVQPDDLPPVLPVVLYNGRPRWQVPNQIADCIRRYPAALEPYIPQVQYLFLDEGRMVTSPQWEERNLAAVVFRAEQQATPEGLEAIGAALDAWLDREEQASLRQALELWLTRSVVPARLPGVALPDTIRLSEVAMLGERLKAWADERVVEGEARGEARGEAHGLITMVRSLVSKGLMTVDQGREQIQTLIDAGEIPRTAGEAALDQLG